jgi:hypothetical protein
MPGIVIHTLLAREALAAWRGMDPVANESPLDPSVVGAFFKGSMAPDMGYYPGGARLVSDLVHRFDSADVARYLVDEATTPVEIAFAWGWLSHLLSDVLLHPAINAAARAVAGRGSSQPERIAEERTAHLRVELGLDAYFHDHADEALKSTWTNVATGSTVELAFVAMRRVYGSAVTRADVERSDNALVRFAPWLLQLTRLIARDGVLARQRCRPSILGAVRQAAASTVSRSVPFLATAVSPETPAPELLDQVTAALTGFGGWFGRYRAVGLQSLDNYDLDTGEPAEMSWAERRDRMSKRREAA